MATKKQRRITELQNKKKKKGEKKIILALIGIAFFGFLVFFFITLFNVIYPPIGGRTDNASKEKISVTLYFSDSNERFLIPEKRFIVKSKTAVLQASEIVKAVLDGSKTGKINTFPPEVKLKDLKIEKNQMAVVSFSKNLVQNHPGGSASEMATIYSLTNSLTANVPEIKSVRILIDGQEVDSIKGHISLRQPFSFNRDYLAQDVKAQ